MINSYLNIFMLLSFILKNLIKDFGETFMERKIILNLAMSIDGYIAGENGEYDWIKGDGNTSLNTQDKWSYEEFLESVDVVVMGKECYDKGFHKDFSEKKVFVATTKSLINHDNVHFIKGNIVDIVLDEIKNDGKNIFLFGGGITLDPFICRNIIDEYIIGIIPIILGKGKRLFINESNPFVELKLTKYLVDEGVVILKYVKR